MKSIIISLILIFIGSTFLIAITAEREGDKFISEIKELSAQVKSMVKQFKKAVQEFEDRYSIEYGKASWYGKPFHGRITASGEVYDMFKVSTAHKTLPLKTWIRVINEENGRKLWVWLNDRGPFIEGRIIDLSYKAARILGVVKHGTVDIKLIAFKEG